MAKIFEMTIWTRGVTIDKEGRDVANGFGQAAAMDGKYVQAFDDYEDLPDRVNVTTRKYVRVSNEEIPMKYIYYVKHPDAVVVTEESIIKGIDILKGMHEGGLLLVNSARDIDYLLKFIPNADILGAAATVDAKGISGVTTVDFSGSEGGVDAAGLGAGIAAPILGALAKLTGKVRKESLAKIVADVSAMERGYEEVKIKKLKPHAEYAWSA